MPSNNNSIIELSNPNYVPVIKDSGISYGGSQMWFPKTHWYSKDYILHNYGCGTIATADMFLYLALQNEDLKSPQTTATITDTGQIKYESYIPYVETIHDKYTKTLRYIAVLGPKVASAINSYSDHNRLGLEASWKWNLTYYDMYDVIENMLDQDIPVIISIGPNTPNLWGKKGVPFYERKVIEYQVTDNIEKDEKVTSDGNETNVVKEKRKPYYYKPVYNDINSHYVTVTGLIKDDVAQRIMLRISSWGKQYYINYEEYRDYIENYSGTITSSLVHVKKDPLYYNHK